MHGNDQLAFGANGPICIIPEICLQIPQSHVLHEMAAYIPVVDNRCYTCFTSPDLCRCDLSYHAQVSIDPVRYISPRPRPCHRTES